MLTDISIDVIPCHCLTVDARGYLRFCNRFLCSDLDYEAGDLVGKKIDLLLPVSSRIFYQTHLMPILTLRGAATEIFLSLQAQNGKPVPILWNISTIGHDDTMLYLFVGILQVNRHKFEKQLIDSRKQALDDLAKDPAQIAARQDADRYLSELAAQTRVINQKAFDLAQFNRVLGHDIREPLRKILMFSGMLRDYAGGDSLYSQDILIEKISASCRQLGQLADNLQDRAMLEENRTNPQAVDLRVVVEKTREALIAAFPEQSFPVNVEGDLTVWADLIQIQSAFYLLLLNLFQNSSSNISSVEVLCDIIDQNALKEIGTGYQIRQTGRIRFAGPLADYGERSFTYLMDLFRSLKAGSEDAFQLSMVKRMIELNEGTMVLESTPGKGVVFTLFLPLKST